MESLFGAISVPIACPVSANVRKKPLNMGIRAKENQDTNVPCRRREYKRENVHIFQSIKKEESKYDEWNYRNRCSWKEC